MASPTIRFIGGRECEGADVILPMGVVLELAREQNGSWGVWGVKVDGKLYREPRDLTAEPLHEGDFRGWVERRFEEFEQEVAGDA